MGQLSEKLLENHIYSVFAVDKQRYQWYEVICPSDATLEQIVLPDDPHSSVTKVKVPLVVMLRSP